MVKKILLPIQKIVETPQDQVNQKSFHNPILQQKSISIETALIYGEMDRFYKVIDPDIEDPDQIERASQNAQIVGLSVINIQYDNDPCSIILFRNWTHNF